MSITVRLWDLDAINIEVPVAKSDGTAKDITGAIVAAAAKRVTDGATVDLAVTVTDAPNGLCQVRIDAESLDPGAWQLQVRVTLGADTQTVLDTPMTIRNSF
jgi:hypothetical protein